MDPLLFDNSSNFSNEFVAIADDDEGGSDIELKDMLKNTCWQFSNDYLSNPSLDLFGIDLEPAPVPFPEPVVVQQEWIPEPMIVQPEWIPEPVIVQPEWIPEPVIVQPEWIPEPVIFQPEWIPEPVIFQPEWIPQPVIVQPEWIPEPVIVQPEWIPEPVIVQQGPDPIPCPRPQQKKRGRPRKSNSEPRPKPEKICKILKKTRKSMTEAAKAVHNYAEQERRKALSMSLEQLRKLVPIVRNDKRVSQKKIVDSATDYLNEQKPIFLSYLKERQRFLNLEKRRRKLEGELASRRKGGFLCVWKERRGMSAGDLYNKVKTESQEDIKDELTDQAILLLEFCRDTSPKSSPSSSAPFSSSATDNDDDQYINVEI